MKRVLIFLLTFVIVINIRVTSNGASDVIPITMYLNGTFIATDVLPYTSNGLTYVPIKSLTDALGIETVYYKAEDNSVTISDVHKTIKLFINQSYVLVNNHEYYIDGRPTIVDGRTMVPVEFVAENFGCKIAWDKLTHSLLITKENLPKILDTPKNEYYPEDVLWLARVVHVEARGTEYECKLAVANVVVNRRYSHLFPNSIYDVIFQPGQFPPAHKSGFSEIIPSDECIRAAKNALNGENNVSKSLYFNNRPFNSKANDLFKIIDGEYFYF
jgi:hypothetical protein